MVSEKVKLF